MAITSSDLGMELGHGGMDMPKRKRKHSMKKKGSEEMDAPSLMKEMAKLHKGKAKKKTAKKSAKKKTAHKRHKKVSK